MCAFFKQPLGVLAFVPRRLSFGWHSTKAGHSRCCTCHWICVTIERLDVMLGMCGLPGVLVVHRDGCWYCGSKFSHCLYNVVRVETYPYTHPYTYGAERATGASYRGTMSSTCVMVCTQQPDFSAALSIQSMLPVNIVVAYLSEEKSIPESFVTDLRADVSNCDTVPPIQWDRVCEDLANGFPVIVREGGM